MKNKILMFVLLFLVPGTLMAQQPSAIKQTPHASVTPLTSKDLPDLPGKEALMISGTSNELINSDDAYIQKFIRDGTTARR